MSFCQVDNCPRAGHDPQLRMDVPAAPPAVLPAALSDTVGASAAAAAAAVATAAAAADGMELDGEGSASGAPPLLLPVVVVAGLAQGLAVAKTEAFRVYDALAEDPFLVIVISACEKFANIDVQQGGANAPKFTPRVSFYLRQCFRE